MKKVKNILTDWGLGLGGGHVADIRGQIFDFGVVLKFVVVEVEALALDWVPLFGQNKVFEFLQIQLNQD